MKWTLHPMMILIISVLASSKSFSQLSTGDRPTTYHLKIGRWLNIYDPAQAAGSRVTSKTELVLDSYVFEAVAEADDGYIIKVLPFVGSGSTALNAKLVFNANISLPTVEVETSSTSEKQERLFYITKVDWADLVEEIMRRSGVTFGLMNVPIKIRPKNLNEDHRKRYLDFEGNVNLGLSIAYYWSARDETMFYLTSGLSITQIRADPTNTNNYLDEPEARGGFSYFWGIVYQNRGFQLSALIGRDFASGPISEHWVYQGKPWVGVGLGIGLFSPDNSPVKKNKIP